MVELFRGDERPERDLVFERGTHAVRGAGVRRAQPPAIGKRDLGRRHALGRRLLEIARAQPHQLGDLLRAANAAAFLVAHGPRAIPGDAVPPELRLLEALALHGLHGVAPEFADPTDNHAREDTMRV